MKRELVTETFLMLYQALWIAALPLLKTNARLRQGFNRRSSEYHLKPADIWIQAASAGESYLALELLGRLTPKTALTILVTTTTAQGLEILNKGCRNPSIHPNLNITTTWFPFDLPSLVTEAAARIKPGIMVLLETEIWPGLLYALKQQGTTVYIINARLSKKSFGRYLTLTWLLKRLSPDGIYAITPKDAARFKRLFPFSAVTVMPNIKFDAIDSSDAVGSDSNDKNNLNQILSRKTALSILASVREAEEAYAAKIIKEILKKFPNQVVALFPRHMQRLDSWGKTLTRLGIPWQLRSTATHPAETGSVILWDTFGELKQAYGLAVTAFVGGSLKPLGGQNFIEPVTCGVATVTGPYLDDFSWTGNGIFQERLVAKADNWQSVARFMARNLKKPPDKKKLQARARNYIKAHQGGTAMACDLLARSIEPACGKISMAIVWKQVNKKTIKPLSKRINRKNMTKKNVIRKRAGQHQRYASGFDYQKNARYFAQISHDLKPLGEKEIIRLGADSITPGFRGIHFTADRSLCYKINYRSRFISRVLAPLTSFTCRNSDELYKQSKKIQWDRVMTKKTRFSVTANLSDAGITHSHFAALRLKDAIVDFFRDRSGKRPDVDTLNPDVRINLHLRKEIADISIDASGGPLHKRGYREASVSGPMQETLAAAIITLSKWDGTTPIHDLMCGSGTLLCEALMKHCRIPAGIFREKFGFETLPDFSPDIWEGVKQEADDQITALKPGIISGSDISQESVNAAKTNLMGLHHGNNVALSRTDFRELPPLKNHTIVANPPYGIRMGKELNLHRFHRELGDFLKQKCKGSTAYLFFGDQAHIGSMGLKASWKKPLKAGGLDGRLVKYELY